MCVSCSSVFFSEAVGLYTYHRIGWCHRTDLCHWINYAIGLIGVIGLINVIGLTNAIGLVNAMGLVNDLETISMKIIIGIISRIICLSGCRT